MAWAVMAMIGSAGRVGPLAASRIAAVASKPSISGICTSISTTSNGRRAQGRDRLPAVRRDVDVVPRFSSRRDGQLLVDRLSSASRIRSAARGLARRAARHQALPRPRPTPACAEHGLHGSRSSSDCLTAWSGSAANAQLPARAASPAGGRST